jgi:transposase
MKIKQHLTPDVKLKIIKSYANGDLIEDLSRIFEVTERSIFNWLKKYSENGNLDHNRKEDKRGRPPKINTTNGKKLLKIVKKPASDFGFETDLWNTSRLKIVCHKNLKIRLSKMAIWRFLNKFEYSFKKVQKQYYETDINAQEEWKKNVLQQIKKTIKKHRD